MRPCGHDRLDEKKDRTMKAITFIKICASTALVALLTSTASFAGDWSGKYMTEDTKGNPFTISLTDDGKASGDKHGTSLSGTWMTNDADAAEIAWDTGWTTMLSKDGDGYKKSAFRAGTPKSDSPTHTTSAKKVE